MYYIPQHTKQTNKNLKKKKKNLREAKKAASCSLMDGSPKKR